MLRENIADLMSFIVVARAGKTRARDLKAAKTVIAPATILGTVLVDW